MNTRVFARRAAATVPTLVLPEQVDEAYREKIAVAGELVTQLAEWYAETAPWVQQWAMPGAGGSGADEELIDDSA